MKALCKYITNSLEDMRQISKVHVVQIAFRLKIFSSRIRLFGIQNLVLLCELQVSCKSGMDGGLETILLPHSAESECLLHSISVQQEMHFMQSCYFPCVNYIRWALDSLLLKYSTQKFVCIECLLSQWSSIWCCCCCWQRQGQSLSVSRSQLQKSTVIGHLSHHMCQSQRVWLPKFPLNLKCTMSIGLNRRHADLV